MLPILALTIGMLGSSQSLSQVDLNNVHRIVMMGDSITQMGAQPKGYVSLVNETLTTRLGEGRIEVINAGISGQKAPDMLARFKHDVLDQHPQVLTLSVGVNDVWHDFRNPEWTARVATGDSGRGIKLPVYLQDVESMVTQAKNAGIKVFLLSPTLVYEDLDCAENKRISEYARAEHSLADRLGVGFVNLNQAFRDVVSAYQKHAEKRSLLLTIDGVHMNDAGNALLADMVLQALGVPVDDRLSPH